MPKLLGDYIIFWGDGYNRYTQLALEQIGLSEDSQKIFETVLDFGFSVLGGAPGILGYVGFSILGYGVDYCLAS